MLKCILHINCWFWARSIMPTGPKPSEDSVEEQRGFECQFHHAHRQRYRHQRAHPAFKRSLELVGILPPQLANSCSDLFRFLYGTVYLSFQKVISINRLGFPQRHRQKLLIPFYLFLSFFCSLIRRSSAHFGHRSFSYCGMERHFFLISCSLLNISQLNHIFFLHLSPSCDRGAIYFLIET